MGWLFYGYWLAAIRVYGEGWTATAPNRYMTAEVKPRSFHRDGLLIALSSHWGGRNALPERSTLGRGQAPLIPFTLVTGSGPSPSRP
jgi:hypothetical protein